MPNWTNEQKEAIFKTGTNIIVSAGAGSGKTAVLSERVLEKLKQNINIDKLLILTFTNKAALEMKERIRDKIKNEETLKEQLAYLDNAYITTFDSYALSIVKKYHYLLNIPKNISIIDTNIIYLEKIKILDKIFEEKYLKKDPLFCNLISTFCLKEDDQIKEAILEINDKLDLKYDKISYLDNYINNYYNNYYLDNIIESFTNYLLSLIDEISIQLETLSSIVDSTYFEKINNTLTPLLSSFSYEEIKSNIKISLPPLPKNSEDYVKSCKEKISTTLKKIEKICIYENEKEIKDTINSTKDYTLCIIDIIKQLDKEILNYKNSKSIYEFNDISKMAITIIKDNEEVKNELKYFYNEIMIDEYQDTSNLQETFVNLIENNNVYMVGDIKQSIYRFRNANPDIFKEKYDTYSKGEKGIKIDLTKNFRSRSEVIEGINLIFNAIMTDEYGKANYKKDHQMIFGNTLYNTIGKLDTKSNLEIKNYEYNKESNYTRDEIEIFTIATDIKNKVEQSYQVFDKDRLRSITYNDFVILIDRTTKFDLYKKIFEYMGIPLRKYADTNILLDDEIIIIKNLLGLIIKINEKKQDNTFKHYLTSILRSYLYNYKDDEIYKIIKNNDYINTTLIKTLKSIDYYNTTPCKLLDDLINKLDFYNKLITKQDISSSINRLESIIDLFNNLSNMGYTIIDTFNYLDTIINKNMALKVNITDTTTSCVNIMTIHKSKGLEFKICYFPSLSNDFNIKESQKRFIYDNNYGIITPYFDEGLAYPVTKILMKEKYIDEEISEKIRLFYVALTRAKEKIILVGNFKNEEININATRNFQDLLNNIYSTLKPYIQDIDLNKINLTKKYNLFKDYNYKNYIYNVDPYDTKYIDIKKEEQNIHTYSSKSEELIDQNTKEKMEFGTKIHYMFENFEYIEKSEYIENFKKCNLDLKNAKIYHEYEFITDTSHGIIDLVLEYENKIILIDFKLKNINKEEYKNQLNGYKTYIENKTNKKTETYLYSILENKLEKISKN